MTLAHLLAMLVIYTTAGVLFLKSCTTELSSFVNGVCRACATSPGPVPNTCFATRLPIGSLCRVPRRHRRLGVMERDLSLHVETWP